MVRDPRSAALFLNPLAPLNIASRHQAAISHTKAAILFFLWPHVAASNIFVKSLVWLLHSFIPNFYVHYMQSTSLLFIYVQRPRLNPTFFKQKHMLGVN
jgi:hypothetical protein